MTDTAEQADIVLPVTTWFENDDIVPTMHPHVLLQERAIEPLFESKSDLEIFSMLAERLGFGDHFNKSPEEYIRLILDSQRLRDAGVTYEALKEKGAFRAAVSPYVPYTDGKFRTSSGRIEFYTERLEEKLPTFHPPIEAWPENPLASKYPLACTQAGARFRIHSQYANIPWFREIDPYPAVELNPADAVARSISEGDVVEVFNDRGKVRLRAKLNRGIRPGMVNISRGSPTKQFISGNSQELIADHRNPHTLNCSFFDTLVEVRKV
jgi:molybdopterin-containing oxidoreductase family molybdopterin binding subunit